MKFPKILMSNMKIMKEEKIGELLTNHLKLLTSEQIDTILKEQKSNPNEKFGEIALRLNFITEKDIAKALALQVNLEYVDLKSINVETRIVRKISAEEAIQYKMLPLYKNEQDEVIVALADPFLFEAKDKAKSLFQKIKFVVVELTPLLFLMQKVFDELSYETQIDELVEQIIDAYKREGPNSQLPLIPSFVNLLILKGLSDNASDIHLVADSKSFRVFYRIRGSLIHFRTFERNLYDAISTQIKQASGMTVGDRLHIEDGAMTVHIRESRQVFLRVNKIPTVPSQKGESLVLRILDRSKVAMKLDFLGFYPEDLEKLKQIALMPYGMILATGPTGSGKTTTLYSALLERNPFSSTIMTVEDPVEYQIPGLRQVQVNRNTGITFASALRAFLRQDPDVILVGEIRDEETAQTAIHAALTGHLVFSTLHTNTAIEAIPRLVELGIKHSTLASALLAVIAQRLVKTLCPFCKIKRKPSLEEKELFTKYDLQHPEIIYEPQYEKHCEHCGGMGYSGMTIVYELLLLEQDEITKIISEGCSSSQIKEVVTRYGFEPLSKNALKKVKDGITSFEEVKIKVLREFS